jgi:hypothetical protein
MNRTAQATLSHPVTSIYILVSGLIPLYLLHSDRILVYIATLSLIRRTACARAQFSGCSSTTNAHSETGQMAVCCQNLTLGVLSSRRALYLLVGALFKKFGLFFEHASYISHWSSAV